MVEDLSCGLDVVLVVVECIKSEGNVLFGVGMYWEVVEVYNMVLNGFENFIFNNVMMMIFFFVNL